MNYLQRLALQENMKSDIKEKNMKEKLRFKFQAALRFPDAAPKIFAQQDAEEDDIPDIEEYDPDNPGFSQEGIDTMLKTLEEFGFHSEVVEDD